MKHFDLGRGRGKERADEIGSHVMYVQWVNRVCEHVKALGKRPMFWGDIIAAHPEAIKRTARGCNLYDLGL